MIRLIEKKDIPQIITLSKALLKLHTDIDPEYYQFEEDYTDKLSYWAEQHIGADSQFVLVYEDNRDNKIKGFISGYIKYLFPWYKIKSVGHVSFLVVDVQFQRQGIGRMLETASYKWFKERGLKFIEVYTNERNIAGITAWNSYGYSSFHKFLRKKINF